MARSTSTPATFDVVVVGAGPAGLSAALWLARYRLTVAVIDAGRPRNAPTWAVHGYLGLPDPAPAELRRIGRNQAEAAGARFFAGTVSSVSGRADRFRVNTQTNRRFTARRILFATGLRDIIPEIPGLLDFYGTSIWHCPDCDGPGVEDLEVGVIGWGRPIVAFCMEMLTWTKKLTILTHGHAPAFPQRSREALDRFDIPVRKEVVTKLEGAEGMVRRAVFADGGSKDLDAIFFHIAYGPGCSLPAELGCKANAEGILRVDRDGETTVPGIFAAGDITAGSKLAVRAAAEGARAALGVYRSLLPAERKV